MAKHKHLKSQYEQLVATFALVSFGFLTMVTAEYQRAVAAEVASIQNRPSSVATTTIEEIQEIRRARNKEVAKKQIKTRRAAAAEARRAAATGLSRNRANSNQ